MTAGLDQTFAAALRAVLVAEATPSPQQPKRTRPRMLVAALGIAVVIGGAAAVAAAVLTRPSGSDTVTAIAPVVSVTGSGTETIQLGQPPAGATRIELQLTCLTPGLFTFADGASVRCGQSDAGRDVTAYSLAINPGQQSTTITAAPDERWHVVGQYASDTATAWRVNGDGHTYGVPNSNGTPDLIAAVATNGQQGYVYADQLQAAQPQPTSPEQAARMHPTPVAIPVYKSDGHTVIGGFIIGNGPGQ
jgi:hypothetical protein